MRLNSPELCLPPAALWKYSGDFPVFTAVVFLWGGKQLAAFCKPKVGGVQGGREHVFKLSRLQEVLRPTRRREKGGEYAWLSREEDKGCNGNRKAEGKETMMTERWFYLLSRWKPCPGLPH